VERMSGIAKTITERSIFLRDWEVVFESCFTGMMDTNIGTSEKEATASML